MMASVKRELMDGSDGSDGEPKLEIADHPVDSDPPSNQDAVESEFTFKLCRKFFKRKPGFNPITFTFSENSNFWRERLPEGIRQNIAG